MTTRLTTPLTLPCTSCNLISCNTSCKHPHNTGITHASNIDYGMSIVTTLCFYLLVFLAFTVGSKVVFPQLFLRLNVELGRGSGRDRRGSYGYGSEGSKSGRRARARDRAKLKAIGGTGGSYRGDVGAGGSVEEREREMRGSGEWGRELFASPDSRSGSPTFNSSQILMEAGAAGGGGGSGSSGRPRSAGKSVAFTDADQTNIDSTQFARTTNTVNNNNNNTTFAAEAEANRQSSSSPSSSTRSNARASSTHRNHNMALTNADNNDDNDARIDAADTDVDPPPPSPYAFGCALPDPLRFLYFACSVDILVVQLLCAFGWCVFGRWGCCDKGACCHRTFGDCCGGCECEDNPDWNDNSSSVHASPPRSGPPNPSPRTHPPSPPSHHTTSSPDREGGRAFTAVSPLSPTPATTTTPHSHSKSAPLQLATLQQQQQQQQSSGGRARSSSDTGTRAKPSSPGLHMAFYFEYILPQNAREKTALLSLQVTFPPLPPFPPRLPPVPSLTSPPSSPPLPPHLTVPPFSPPLHTSLPRPFLLTPPHQHTR